MATQREEREEGETPDPDAGLVWFCHHHHLNNQHGSNNQAIDFVDKELFSSHSDVNEGDTNTHAASFYTNI